MKIITLSIVFLGCTCFAFGQRLNVLSYNIKFDDTTDTINGWENRKQWIASQLKEYGPMVFGTQEGLKKQLDFLRGKLEGYTYFGLGRDKGADAGEYSAIFFDTTKLKLIKNNTFWLSKTPHEPSRGWDAALNRICTYGLFELKKTGKRFFVFNTHLDHMGKIARHESITLILSRIAEINTDELPVILMGDFNLEPETRPIQLLLKYMRDAHKNQSDNTVPSGTYNGFDTKKRASRRIDYIFFQGTAIELFNSGIIVESRNGTYPSDHFPVFANFVIR